MLSRSQVIALAVIGVLTVAIWLGAVPLAAWVAGRYPEQLLAASSVGPGFDVAASLFAGLGLVVVATVLLVDITYRRRVESPFLVPAVEDGDVSINQGQWIEGELLVGLLTKVRVRNESKDIALNCTVNAELRWRGGKAIKASRIDYPLRFDDPVRISLAFYTKGNESVELARALAEETSVTLELVLKYKGLNGTGWRSNVTFILSADADVRGEIEAMREPGPQGEIALPAAAGAGAVDYPLLGSRPAPDSWSHKAT